MKTIAALFVDPRGSYVGLPSVDLWDETRDARLYAGPYPVIAHPPCSRWCQLAGLVEARWGHKKGEDDGCFESALSAVRRFGGVLEHPAYSSAWSAFDLNRPPSAGGWVNADFQGGWTCYVEQSKYGHRARKATWLYAVGCDLPSLLWGNTPKQDVTSVVSWCGDRVWSGNRVWSGADRPRIGKKEAAATPDHFRNVLVSMARSVPTR